MADEPRINPALEHGYEHRIGAKLFDYDYNDSIDKEDLVSNIRECIDSLYTTSLDKQRAACNIKRVGGMMSDFKCDINANAFYGFSSSAYALKFPMKNIFWFNSLFVNRLNRHSGGYKRQNISANKQIINPITSRHRNFFSISDVYPTPINYNAAQSKSTGNVSHRIEQKTDATTKTTYYMKYIESTSISGEVTLLSSYRYDPIKDAVTGEVSYRRIRYPYSDSDTPVIVYSLDEDDSNLDNFHIMYNITDTANRPDIFTHQLLFFVDGKLLTDVQMYVVPNYVIMVLDPERLGITSDRLYEYTLEYYDYRWTLIGIPFGNYYTVNAKSYKHMPDIPELDPPPEDKHLGVYISSYKTLKNVYAGGEVRYSKAYDHTVDSSITQRMNIPFQQYTLPFNNIDDTTSSVFLTGYPADADTILIKNRSYPRNDALLNLSINPVVIDKESRIISDVIDNNIPPRGPKELIVYESDVYVDCLGDSSVAYQSLGTKTTDQFADNTAKFDLQFIELKNASAVIDLGINRIFQIGCSGNLPGPVPPENILIFKYDEEEGMKLVHMVSSEYKDTNLETSKYNKKSRLYHKPDENSLAFSAYESDSLYDYPNFIPTKDEYNVGSDVHGTYNVIEYTTEQTASGNKVITGEAVSKHIDTVRDTQKWIELYFPNVYKLVGFNPEDNLVAIVFYNKDCGNSFDNPLKHYMQYNSNYANDVVSGNIPLVIKNYIPEISKYTEDVYLNTYHTKATRAVEHQFKLEALREFVNDDQRRLVNIYDRHYAKQHNKMHANIKYIIDLTKTRDEATRDDFNIRHFYKDQFVLQNKSTFLHYITSYSIANDPSVKIKTNGFKLYNNINGGYICDLYELGIVDEDSNYRWQSATVTGNHVSIQWSFNMEYENELVPVYRLTVSHREKMKFPMTVWRDGIRVANDKYSISSNSFSTIIDIDESVVTQNTKYIEIEIYKMADINAKETIITLPDMHNSICLDTNGVYNAWKDISPQHMMVAIEKDTIGDNGEDHVIRYMIPSSYESYWLLIGHTNYVNGYPTNLNDDDRRDASITAFNVIKSMQANYRDSSGNLYDKDDVVILADENTVLIGETEQTFGGDVDLLTTFGSDQYFKMLTSDAQKREYILMLREGYYSRDRRRFYDYIPMGKKDPKVYITPITDFFANKTVKIKNTDVFFTKTFTKEIVVNDDTSRRIVIEDFEFDPSPFKYRLFLDGKLMDYDYDYISNVNLDDENFYMDSDMTLYFRNKFTYDSIHNIVFEYLPYKYQLIYRSIEHDGIITLSDEYIRPFDFRNFDIYVDGILVAEDDIEVITERRVALTKVIQKMNANENYHPIVSVYERMHDADVFDYVWRNHKTAFNYIDHENPRKPLTTIDPITGETVPVYVTEIDPVTGEEIQVQVYDDNVLRYPSDTNEFIDVKMAQRISHSLDEQLIRSIPDYKAFRIPFYDIAKTKKEGPIGFDE